MVYAIIECLLMHNVQRRGKLCGSGEFLSPGYDQDARTWICISREVRELLNAAMIRARDYATCFLKLPNASAVAILAVNLSPNEPNEQFIVTTVCHFSYQEVGKARRNSLILNFPDLYLPFRHSCYDIRIIWLMETKFLIVRTKSVSQEPHRNSVLR